MKGKKVTKQGVSEKTFGKKDYQYLAEHIIGLWKDRKEDRKCLEKQWDDIDRQIAMKPDAYYKLDSMGRPDQNMAWMPEIELPLQSTTLEITTADARRMQFPDSGPWYCAHSALTDDYLQRVDFQSLITGDEMEVPSIITQDNADKLVAGALNNYHRQYPFFAHMDMINSEAIKYSMGVGRARIVTKQVFYHTKRGVVKKNQQMPILVPRSIKNTYLDENPHNLMNEGLVVKPSIVTEKTQAWADVMMAAMRGSTDPEDSGGGWIPANVKTVEKDKHGNIKMLELEGDLLVSRKTTEDIYVPNCTITVALGDGEASYNVVRLRFNKYPESSFILFPYQRECIETPYGTSPLMKGRPIQTAAVDALVRLMMVSALRSLPPVSRPSDDDYFNKMGGVPIYPGADWPTTGQVVPHEIGDPSAMMSVYMGLLQQYADVTAVNAPRLGAQTLSHTTAYAKEAELSRGTIRTVDYVKATMRPLEEWLNLEFKMAKDIMGKMPIYLDEYGGYVDVDKNSLPDMCVFDVYGSGGPQEESDKQARRIQGINMAVSMEQVRLNLQASGLPSNLEFTKIEEMILRESGITDLDAVMTHVQNQAQQSLTAPPNYPSTGALAQGSQLT